MHEQHPPFHRLSPSFEQEHKPFHGHAGEASSRSTSSSADQRNAEKGGGMEGCHRPGLYFVEAKEKED